MSSPAQADGRACTRDSTERSPQLPGSHSQLPGRAAKPWCATVSVAQAFVAVMAAMVSTAVGSMAAMSAATTNIHNREYRHLHTVAAHLYEQDYLPRNTSLF